MAFIRTIPEEEAKGPVAELYQADRDRLGYVANYTRVLAHRPDAYRGWAELNGAIKQAMDLRRYELATLAAALRLRSSYCALAHGRVLRDRFLGPEVLSGHDLGPVVEELWFNGDYEYWIVLTPERKDRALTALVRDHFSDPEELRDWLDVIGVRHRSPEEAPPGWDRLSRSGAGRRVLVAEESRDWVLLSLLRRLHRAGVFSLSRTFTAWLKEKRIPFYFSSYA